MSNNDTQYLTKEKYEDLKKELEFLKTTRRKEVAESLEYAKKLGDLSENAEYHEAREEQAKVEDRIMRIENILKTAEVMGERKEDTIGIGSSITVRKEGTDEPKKFRLVSSEEADMMAGKLSNSSPLGNALIGKKKGDKVEVCAPKGKNYYEIISVE